MCELFGYSSTTKADLRPFLKSFYLHSIQHPHGWGISYPIGEKVFYENEPVRAIDSPYLLELVNDLEPKDLLLAHIRLASVGSVKKINCHPFIRIDLENRRWVQMHNGTIFHCPTLEPYKHKQEGSTDSERILLYIMDQVNEAIQEKKTISIQDRIEIVENTLEHITTGNNKVNYMLYDGQLLYIHTNMKKTLYSLDYENGQIFSTTPLSNGDWKELPLCTLLVYQDGKCIYTGKNTNHEYIFDPTQIVTN